MACVLLAIAVTGLVRARVGGNVDPNYVLAIRPNEFLAEFGVMRRSAQNVIVDDDAPYIDRVRTLSGFDGVDFLVGSKTIHRRRYGCVLVGRDSTSDNVFILRQRKVKIGSYWSW
jgi:hypothetical protein